MVASSTFRSARTALFACLFFLSGLAFSQTVIVTVSPDNCMNPVPNSGTYTLSGTMNGKNMYSKGPNLRIVWTGTQWELQGDDPSISGVTWITGWFNTNNTPTPPADCWASSFGCFIPIFSGPDAFPVVTVSGITLVNPNPSSGGILSYMVNFSGTINSLSTSNFSLNTTGTISGATVVSVTQISPGSWSVTVNAGTGDGNIRLDLINITGASAVICTLPFNGSTYNVFSTIAPVSLSAGDIAFTGFNSSAANDDFSFIVLKSGGLTSGTQIMFTDNGWNNVTGSSTSSEGVVVWQATTTVAQFAQVQITVTASSYSTTTGTCTKISPAYMSLPTTGDQVLAFQGNLAAPVYISGVHFNADNTGSLSTLAAWDNFSNGANTSRSALPPGLTNGQDAVMVVTGNTASFVEWDNGIYACVGAVAPNVAAVRASINDRYNWLKQDSPIFTLPTTCSFGTSPALFALKSQNDVTCNSACNGSASVTASGGSSPFLYSWSPSGGGGNSVSGLCAGNYTCTITDATSSSITRTFAIIEPTALSATQTQTNITCATSGIASVTASGGTGAYTYSWNPSGSTLAGNPVSAAGNYTCTIKDVNNCALAKTFTITSNTTAPTLSITGATAICNGQSALLTVTGANTYSWNTAAVTSTISVNPGTTTIYAVTGTTTANSCSAIAQYTVLVNAVPLISVNSGSICSGNAFTIVPSGAFTYTLSGGSNFTVNPLTTTSYSVTGTSTAGCAGSTTAVSTVTVYATPTITAISGTICAGQVFTISANGANTYVYSSGSNTVSPVTTSSYSVSGMSAEGCNSASAAIVNVTVNPLPVITVNSGTICQGNSFTISPAGAANYTLSSSNTVVSPTASTVYSVTGVDVLGCLSAGPALSSVTVFAIPVLTISSSNPVICTGNSATLTANGANSYLWSTAQASVSIVVSPTTSTSYSVVGTDGHSCNNAAVITQSVSDCTALNERARDDRSILLYPNPNNGTFNIELHGPLQVQISNIAGEIIWTQQLDKGTNQLDLGKVANGIYFVRFSGAGTFQTLKLIKE